MSVRAPENGIIVRRPKSKPCELEIEAQRHLYNTCS